MRRREFIMLFGSAAAWPVAARAQQAVMPVIGFLSSLRATDEPLILASFRRGLENLGYFEGRNVAIEYRWAAGRFEQLPVLAADLVGRQVAVIAAISGTPSALAAKAATEAIPIVFAMGSDPIDQGLVVSLNRPGGNITGATFFTAALGPKRLELLRELMVNARTVVLLVNPDNPAGAADTANVLSAAQALGQTVKVVEAVTGGDIDAAFVALSRDPPNALYIGPDPLFFNQRDRLAALGVRYRLPAIYGDREIVEVGGLISYGAPARSASKCRQRCSPAPTR
jgi:ABC-type uncharacterized transport system substrate-binding protein